MITEKRLDELFEFDPEVGFFNRHSRGRAVAGARAGHLDVHGYRRIVVDYVKYYEHHLVWFYVYGEWPVGWPNEMDHKDGDRSNNSVENLRLADKSRNSFNREQTTGVSGLRGAYWDERATRWYSKIQLGGQQHYLGQYDTAEEAHRAYKAAANRLAGEFAFHNRELDTVT